MFNGCFGARLIFLGAGLMGCSVSALAQDASGATGVLAEVVITAEKRVGTVQDAPLSITAFSGADLAAAGVSSTFALANATPGLTVQRDIIGKVVIRGVGTENYTAGSDPGVAIHKDGLYIARSTVALFDFFDTSRVEVLRGPQGTLYGRNATGGVINIISNEPTEEFGGYAQVDVGNFNKRRIEAVLNAPLGDTVQSRLSVLYAERDGYTKNLFPGAPATPPSAGFPGTPAIPSARESGVDQLDNQELWAVRGQVKFQLGDSGALLLSGEITRDDSLPPASKNFDGEPWTLPTDMVLPDLREVSQGFEMALPGTNRTIPSAGRADQDAISARLTWDFGGLTLMSLSGYRKINFSWLNDGDGLDQFFVNYFQTDESEQFSQEFQLTSPDDSRLQWMLGAYYLTEDATGFMGVPFIIPVPQPVIMWDGKSDTTAYAVFGQMTYKFTDKLSTTLGVRYNHEKKQGDLTYNLFGGLIEPAPPVAPVGTTWAEVLDRSWDAVTPKLGVSYDFTDDVMGYASATRGFKSGGLNLLAGQTPYDPEYLWSYELGVKSRMLGGRLIANLGAFYYDYKDLQVGKVVNLTATVVNAAKASIQGAELELRASPTDGFEINAGLAYLDATYDEFETEDPGWPGDAGCGQLLTAPRTISLAGCDLPRSPQFQGSLGAQWSVPLATGAELRLRGDYAYRDKQYFTQFNRDNVSQDSYGTFNARITYTAAGGKWAITAYGDNLTDEDYFITVLESGVSPLGTVVPQAAMGPPRTYGVLLRYDF